MIKMKPEQLKKFAKNLLLFTAPALALFFGALSQGLTWKEASPVAIMALWGLLADLFKKIRE